MIGYKKSVLFIATLMLCFQMAVNAQRYFTKTGTIEFYSKAPLEDIKAKNKTATAVLDTKTGNMQFSVLMKGFEFPKALMQEHFNDNYVESHKYPKAEFRGSIADIHAIDFDKEGTYAATARGQLSIHGVTRNIEARGTVHVGKQQVTIESDFNVLLSDYRIRIPAVVKDKLSNQIKVTVRCSLQPL